MNTINNIVSGREGHHNTISKLSLISDVKNRLYEQELGARSIQDTLSKAKLTVDFAASASNVKRLIPPV